MSNANERSCGRGTQPDQEVNSKGLHVSMERQAGAGREGKYWEGRSQAQVFRMDITRSGEEEAEAAAWPPPGPYFLLLPCRKEVETQESECSNSSYLTPLARSYSRRETER